ncbi:MAG TPA: aminotransferase class V-fold PLP-dependent enzyme, partial [Steroidobacteraceae bacterium]|nr:aminotransferase class V-fold PLP-dependent enzyme [Steroidobacteraceae bacterium]
RGFFPFVKEAVYLNTATAGLAWKGLGDASAAFYEAKLRGICGRSEWVATVARARAALAGLLSVEAEAVSFTGSATEALNLACLGLPLPPGSRIAVAADEFPSVWQACLTLRKSGIDVKAVEIPRESDRSAALAEAAAGAQALAVSHVHWRTGTCVDIERIGAACRASGAWLIVDGVQAVGAMPVRAGLADAYCGSSFKWLLGGFGLGFMTLSERLAREWTPPLRGYANEWPSRDPQYGHLDYPGIYALDASLAFLDAIGWEAIFERVARLRSHLCTSLPRRGFDVLTPAAAAAGIVSIRRDDAADLVERLAQESIFVEDRDAIVRASPHFYNTEAELDRFMEALTAHSRAGGKRAL